MIIKRSFLALIIIGVMAVLVTVMGACSSSDASSDGRQIEGSWVVTITEGPGTPDLPSWYAALVTFGGGGGLVATITDPLLSTGHGAWVKTGSQKFAVTILLRQFDPEGNFLGTLKARATLILDDTSGTFSSDDYQFEFFDIDGNPTGFVGTGAAHGTRIVVEPLE